LQFAHRPFGLDYCLALCDLNVTRALQYRLQKGPNSRFSPLDPDALER